MKDKNGTRIKPSDTVYIGKNIKAKVILDKGVMVADRGTETKMPVSRIAFLIEVGTSDKKGK
jgi:hypothetical protein